MNGEMGKLWAALAFMFLAAMGARLLQADVTWDNSSAAAWVQAIGSIGAIWAGFELSARTQRNANQRDRQRSVNEAKDYALWAESMADRVVINLEALAGQDAKIRLGEPERHIFAPLQMIVDDIGRLDPPKFHDWNIAIQLHNVRGIAGVALEVLRHLSEDGLELDRIQREIELASKILENARQSRCTIRQRCVALGLPSRPEWSDCPTTNAQSQPDESAAL